MFRLKITESVSIKSRLIKVQLSVSFFVLLACTLAFLVNDLFIFKRSVERSLKSTARILGQNLEPTLAFSDKKEAIKILSSLQSEPSIVKAYLFDQSGNAFAQYGTVESKQPHISNLQASQKSELQGTHHLILYHKLGQENDPQGLLYFDADLLVFASEYETYVWIFGGIFIAVLIFSIGLAHLAQRSLSGPIQNLAHTVRTISLSGDYSIRMSEQDTLQKIDEIETLSKEFNQMLEQIQIRDQKIRNEKDIAEKANQSKSVFLANMSHELRTPMHGILSYARFGQQKVEISSKEKLKSYFDEIYESGSRLMSLLNDLLDLSKLEAGKVNYLFQKTDLLEVVRSALSEMNAFAKERGLKIEYSCPCKEAMTNLDVDRFLQVLRNLLSNAIKFSNKGSTIHISVNPQQDGIRCTVINHGIGIPTSELESVFDKFVQSSKTKSGAGGTGLGLAICREIVEQHGGKIWAESELSGETRFIITLHGLANRAKEANQSENEVRVV